MKLEFGEKRRKQVGRAQAMAFSFGFYPFFSCYSSEVFSGYFHFSRAIVRDSNGPI